MPRQFGDKDNIVLTIKADATSVAVNTDHLIIPSDAGTGYKCISMQSTQSVASSSGTLKVRAITDTTAPGAAASATCVELCGNASNTISTSSTANTVATATLVDTVVLPGSRIATLSGGTQTNLVGFTLTLVFAPVDNRV